MAFLVFSRCLFKTKKNNAINQKFLYFDVCCFSSAFRFNIISCNTISSFSDRAKKRKSKAFFTFKGQLKIMPGSKNTMFTLVSDLISYLCCFHFHVRAKM